MEYGKYIDKFNENDLEHFPTLISNAESKEFLLENAPRLYCPDEVIEETFAFRTWTMRKHIRKSPAGIIITEFLPDVSWAGKYNTINCPLFHHLREFRWLGCADVFLDFITFFTRGEGSRYAYHDPALSAMYDFCITTGNEQYLLENIDALEAYFEGWCEKHYTKNGLYWSQDDREGCEFSISGTTPAPKMVKGFRPLMNGCMFGDAIALSKIERLAGREDRAKHYEDLALSIKEKMDEKMWDGDFYKAVHTPDEETERQISVRDVIPEMNVRELVGYVPFAYGMPDKDKTSALAYIKDERVFKAKMGLATADISHPRFLYNVQNNRACTWSGKVWPFATSLTVNAMIRVLSDYEESVITNSDLYDVIKTYASMHYLEEDGTRVNYIDETMLPFEPIWIVRERFKDEDYVSVERGGKLRGKDYNHSTFIDLVIRGLCGVNDKCERLNVAPRVTGIWKWFKLENLSFRKKRYNVYYDEDGTVFGKGKGVIIEEV